MKANTIKREEICSYTTVDGQTFEKWVDAFNHESALLSKREIYSRTVALPFEDTEYGELYKIDNYEDYLYLRFTIWNSCGSSSWKGPGWYLVFHYDGGDYPDNFTIYYVPNYLNDIAIGVANIQEIISDI